MKSQTLGQKATHLRFCQRTGRHGRYSLLNTNALPAGAQTSFFATRCEWLVVRDEIGKQLAGTDHSGLTFVLRALGSHRGILAGEGGPDHICALDFPLCMPSGG